VSMVFGLDLILATFVLVVLACFKSWDHFFFSFSKILVLGIGSRVSFRLALC